MADRGVVEVVVFRLFWGAVSGVAGAWAGLGIKKGPTGIAPKYGLEL